MSGRPAAPTRILLLTTLLLLGLTLAQAASLGREEAVARVTETEFGGSMDGVRLFVLPELLGEGEAVGTWRREVFRAPAAGWLVFVDRVPGANWEHPCSYYFVDQATGRLSRFDAMTPPMRLAELEEITDGRDNPPAGLSEALLDAYSRRLRELPKPPAPARGQAWAFIISGGANQSNNHIRYWNDSAFIYRTLVEYYGYADDHIRVCISDGTNPAADRSDGSNSPPDLDGDGDADIEYPATQDYIDQVFAELAGDLTSSDQFFLFTTDHGGQESGQDCYLNLWNLQEMRDDHLASLIDALPCQTVICTFEQCFSGGMVDDIEADGRVIATAANWNEYSWAMAPDYIYDTFVYHWTSAVAWATPYGDPVDADSDDDGVVSMREAFLYAEAHDYDDETPQYSSIPGDLGDALTLFGSMEGVYLALDDLVVDDDQYGASDGNGDGVIDYGETIELTISLGNMGTQGATGVTATLASASPYVTVTTATAGFGDIPSDGTGSNATPFVLEIDPSIPHGEDLMLTLLLSEVPGDLALDLAASAPAWIVTVSEIIDTGEDGQANPGEDLILTLNLANIGGSESPFMDAVLSGGGYFTVGATPRSVPEIPGGGDADVAGFSVQVSPLCPEVYTGQLLLTLTGSSGYSATADVYLMVGPWFDDVESDLAWVLGAGDDTASSGIWERVDPIGTDYNGSAVQPEDDHTADPGHICFVTGNGSVGGSAGENDVDGGKTTLLSPLFSTENATSVEISYWRWYSNDLGNNPGEDWWDVDVAMDGNWVSLEHTQASANSWTRQSFDLSEYVLFGGDMQFRFVAADEANASLVEAAVDDIMVAILRTPVTATDEPAAFRLRLDPCVPNPFNPWTRIAFELPEAGPATVVVYDVSGRSVKTLLDERMLEAGPQTLEWHGLNEAGRPVASGVYFVRLWAPAGEVTRSMTLLR